MDEQAWLAERFEENRAQRVCLDMLRSRTSRREESLGAHASRPIVRDEDGIDRLIASVMRSSVLIH
jgi:hypothetical protein